jgi:HD-GYP domain-containing protein (c-di-GMP phosphodiesterase class II)
MAPKEDRCFMDEQLRQEAVSFLQARLGIRSVVLDGDSLDSQAENFLLEFSDCCDPHDTLSIIAMLRETTRSGITLRLPRGHHDHLVAVPLGSEGAVCASIQTGTAMLAQLAVENACEAWSFARQLSEFRSEHVRSGSNLRVDGPHALRTPHVLRESSSLQTLRAMCSAIDARDQYTRGHSERVARFAFELAQRLGLSTSACYEIYLAGMLHDIGKIGTPDAVLLKENALTDEEFAVIRQHPEIGYRIVERMSDLYFALPGILHHHERWDGGGYPHGLAGESTPLMARILAVADSFDAMTSCRVYRKAMPIQEATAIIAAGSGSQWDPRITECLVKWSENLAESNAHPAVRALQMLPQCTMAQHSSVESMYQAIVTLGH